MKAQDILPDEFDQRELQGVAVRKGTVGAFLVNARTWCDANSTARQREGARRDIVEALPALRALGLFQILSIRDPLLRELVDKS